MIRNSYPNKKVARQVGRARWVECDLLYRNSYLNRKAARQVDRGKLVIVESVQVIEQGRWGIACVGEGGGERSHEGH